MDGNGRWAKKRFLPRTAGHREGMERVTEIVEAAFNINIKYLISYTLFLRKIGKDQEDEIEALMKLLVQYIRNEIDKLIKII